MTHSKILFKFAFLMLSFASLCFSKQPNILILYADDLGYGDLTCYNPESKIPTPNLDKLASEGVRFTDGHSSSGICTPSRYALLTGRYHWRKFHGIVGAFGKSVFDSERLTLPEMLQENGYYTSAIGKWHLGWDWDALKKEGAKKIRSSDINDQGVFSARMTYHYKDLDWSRSIPGGPLAHGFDYYFGDTVINFPPYGWIENDKVLEVPTAHMDTSLWKSIKEGAWECRPGPMVKGWDPYENIPETTRRGVEQIKMLAKQDKPFFMYFAFPSPHGPIIPNDEFDDSSKAGPYGDVVVETDAACGRLLDALKDAGVDDNTIVFFSADNGPAAYAYQRDEKYGHWSSYPLRGLKQDIYEGGHRVPYIIKWPGVKEGKVSDAIISQIDFMATVAAKLDIELAPDQAHDSFNQLPVITGEVRSVRDSIVHNTNDYSFAYRMDDWVLLCSNEDKLRRGGRTSRVKWGERHGYHEDYSVPVQLFNLKEDLGQKHNLALKHPEKVKELQARLAKVKEQGYSAPRLRSLNEK